MRRELIYIRILAVTLNNASDYRAIKLTSLARLEGSAAKPNRKRISVHYEFVKNSKTLTLLSSHSRRFFTYPSYLTNWWSEYTLAKNERFWYTAYTCI